MNNPCCDRCGGPTKKNGKTPAGRTRWRCKDPKCGASSSRSYDTRSRDLQTALDWLLSRRTQREHPLPERTLRRRCEILWDLWPVCPVDDVVHDVVHIDGIHLGRKAVALIAMADGHVIGWHIAKSESCASWTSLISRIAPPLAVVCDGCNGMLKAIHAAWPATLIQRCLFHVCMNVTTLTTNHPRLPAGRDLRELAIRLANVRDELQARRWLVDYNAWRVEYRDFLAQKTIRGDGAAEDTHRRLCKARNQLDRHLRENNLFTFLADLGEGHERIPSTNNRIESLNARLREMLRDHRGQSLTHRLHAICWWCQQHTENPEPASSLIDHCYTNEQIARLYEQAWERSPQGRQAVYGIPARYGTGIDWNEFHTSTPYNNTG